MFRLPLPAQDRDKYVTGEFRFRHGYAKHNPRKMVKVCDSRLGGKTGAVLAPLTPPLLPGAPLHQTWAEKEFRNLARLHAGGVPCPKPLELKAHIVVMEFFGVDGWPAPRLKDADISQKRAKRLYHDCIVIMRRMFQDCRLVHGDLSEYNML